MKPIKLFFYKNWGTIEQYLIPIFTLTIVFFALRYRLSFINQVGKDVYAYERAVGDLISGINPYKWTVESFSNPDDLGNHGYSYFPGALYIFAPLYLIHLRTGVPYQILWKIPILLADLGVGFLLYKLLKDKGVFVLTTALAMWFFNPYSVFRSGYTYTDPLTIFFMLASLMMLKEDDVLAGTFYGLSIAFKTFPYILFPVMLLKAKKKKAFLISGLLVGLVVSIPFLKSVDDFTTYLNGTLFVHQNRFVQGQPFLFYLSYYYKIELFQIIPFKVYTLLASFSGWIIALVVYYFKLIRDRYILALIPFLTFYLFTPVFNRTYFLWFIPIYIMACYRMFKDKHKILFYISQFVFFAFAGWYLVQWKDGFHIWHP